MEEPYLPLFEEADREKGDIQKPKKKPSTARVVLVQSVCCAALILFFWLFKVLGGAAYLQLKTAFMNALQNNALMATVAQLFEEGVPDEKYTVTDGTTAGVTDSTTGTTAGTTATTAATTANATS